MAALTLELIDLRPGPADDHSWMPPFDEAVGYANPHWWNPLLYDAEHPWYVQVLEAGAEVARVELDEDATSSTTRRFEHRGGSGRRPGVRHAGGLRAFSDRGGVRNPKGAAFKLCRRSKPRTASEELRGLFAFESSGDAEVLDLAVDRRS